MPTADPLTAIREANDISASEEAAWLYVEQFVATPMLLGAAIELSRIIAGEQTTDWFNLKAQTNER